MDEIWKEIIEELFHDFCFFFMPDLAKHIDFSMGYEFLDKELLKIYPESEEIKRFADKLVRNEDELTSPIMHHSFRPSLPDLKVEKF